MSDEATDLGSLKPKSKVFILEGRRYEAREAGEGAVEEYRDAITAATEIGEDGKPKRFKGLAQAESVLVSRCLFEMYEHGGEVKERPVLLSAVRSWPSRVVRPLFDFIESVSELWPTAKDKEAAKNEPAATPDTSDSPTS